LVGRLGRSLKHELPQVCRYLHSKVSRYIVRYRKWIGIYSAHYQIRLLYLGKSIALDRWDLSTREPHVPCQSQTYHLELSIQVIHIFPSRKSCYGWLFQRDYSFISIKRSQSAIPMRQPSCCYYQTDLQAKKTVLGCYCCSITGANQR
jgi:hypothetical protein